ncbi:MAG TPA: hydroxyacylglutathione hydrolase [Candidatus Kapabacteria bacterium]|nr:hydroxyacylglutathione hydrolase [Candidatus Kapabacteria bacterium]
MSNLHIHPISAFSDNYIWCLHNQQLAVVVDPGDAGPVQRYLQQQGLQLAGILVTHHHPDHIAGINTLVEHWPGIPVWGPAQEHIPARTQALQQGNRVQLPLGLELQVLDVPGHTLGHIAYFGTGASTGPVLFCGDTLFSSGCGRLFEGTPEQMFHSLGLFRRLPGETRVFCTHEYTLSNLKFALAVEPDNMDIQQRKTAVEQLRADHLPSLPSTLALELKVNPFLRTDQAPVIEAVSRNCGARPASEAQTFARLRAWKDHF